jgi:ADP-ribose pyrophosphatase
LSINTVIVTKMAIQTSSQSSSLPIDDCERCTPASTRPYRAIPLIPLRMNTTPKTLRSQEIYKGRIFTLRVDSVLVDGKEHQLDIIEHPGSFAILPVTSEDGVILVRQYRQAAGCALWEIPAGTAETGESHEDGARRELREETGFTAESLEPIAGVYPTPGYSTERVWVYAARGLLAGPQELEEDESIEVREFTLETALAMQATGEIIDMKTVLALLWLAGLRRK